MDTRKADWKPDCFSHAIQIVDHSTMEWLFTTRIPDSSRVWILTVLDVLSLIFFFNVIDFWWSYITIFLCYRYIIYIYWLQFTIFSPCRSFNRRSPFNHLRNKPKAFLVSIPGMPAGSSSSLRCYCAAPRFSSCRLTIWSLTVLLMRRKRSRKTRIRSLDPWHRMSLLMNKPTRPRCPLLSLIKRHSLFEKENNWEVML